MRRLTIEVDYDISDWIERRRGNIRPEDFAAHAIKSYRAIDEHSTAAKMAHMQDEMAKQLDELQLRIERLNRCLQERRAVVRAGMQR